jgi:hypothetical protein
VRFLLDTNIIVSGLLTKQGPPGMLLDAWLFDYRFDLITSKEQIDELRRALGYERLRSRIDPVQAHDVLANLEVRAILATDLPTLDVSPDPDDNVILATAVAGRADAVVSGTGGTSSGWVRSRASQSSRRSRRLSAWVGCESGIEHPLSRRSE